MDLFTDIKDFTQGLFRGFKLFVTERPAATRQEHNRNIR